MDHLEDGVLFSAKKRWDVVPWKCMVDLNDCHWLEKPVWMAMHHVIPTKGFSAKEESLKIVKDGIERKERWIVRVQRVIRKETVLCGRIMWTWVIEHLPKTTACFHQPSPMQALGSGRWWHVYRGSLISHVHHCRRVYGSSMLFAWILYA